GAASCDETPISFVTNSHPCKKRKGGAASGSKGGPAPPLSPRMAWKRPTSNWAVMPRSAAKRQNCLTTSLTEISEATRRLSVSVTSG
ncbi:MAG: hypothetical protein WCF48_09605, partial [Terriglobales bacterium]